MKRKFNHSSIISKNLFSLFINSNLHIGFSKLELTKNFNFLLYGFRNNIGIFDLNYIYFSIQKFLKLFFFEVKKQKIIVFVDAPDFFVKKSKYLKNKYYFINSNSTNPDLNFINFKKIGLIFFFKNTLYSSILFKRTKQIGLLTSGFYGTVTNFNYDIPIFGNFTSKKSIFFLCSLILNYPNINNKSLKKDYYDKKNF